MDQIKFEQFQSSEKLQFIEALASQFYNTFKSTLETYDENGQFTYLAPSKEDEVIFPFKFYEAAGYLRHYLKVFGLFLVGEEGYEAYDDALNNSKFFEGDKAYKMFKSSRHINGAYCEAKFETDPGQITKQMNICINALELCTRNYPTSDSLLGLPLKLEEIVSDTSNKRSNMISLALEIVLNGLTTKKVLELNERIVAISQARHIESQQID